MEELIEKALKKYPTMDFIKIWPSKEVAIMKYGAESDETIIDFASLEDLRNHLNE